MADTRRLITLLVVLLIIITIVAGAVLWLLPGAPEEPGLLSPIASPSQSPLFVDTSIPTSPLGEPAFNLDVLRGSLYQSLNHQVVNDGSLPVQPPAATGKANPFI